MQPTIDVSIAVSDFRGVKRPASPLSPRLSSSAEHRQPLLEHELLPTSQACYQKRLRTSDPNAPLKTQNTHVASATAPSSTSGSDFREREVKVAEEARKPNYEGLGTTDLRSNMVTGTATPFTSTRDSRPGGEPSGPGEFSKPRGRCHNFFIKASIYTPRGVIDLERVHVDERCPFNLVPWSMVTNLGLVLYSGEASTHPLNQINQYSQLTIRVAGHTTTINTGVISGLKMILLGREWIRSVHLLSDSRNQNYYIPIPLAVEAAEVDTETEAKDVKPVEMTTCEEIAEEHDDDELHRSSPDVDLFSESELPLDGQDVLHGDSPDEPSSVDHTLSDGRTCSEGPSKHEVRPTDEDDEVHIEDGGDGDDHGDKDYDGNVGDECDDCEGCEQCDGYDECEGCEECEGLEYEEFGEGEEHPDDNLLQQYMHLESITDAEHTKEAHQQQSDPKDESALPSSYLPDLQPSGVEGRITKHQCKEIANILDHISRTTAGQSFKAPVEQLWPEFAGAYAAKVPNPIDLGTIQLKVKNDIYPSVDAFRADVVLLYQNSIDFNGVDHIITSTALEVRDTILSALDDMEEGKSSMMLRASTRITGA
ncbi:hypothetical protein DL98DRAFT_540644 [Cadophora sp. DSE1049]|nr:hypothetical protein DL98DRAFT_540644 [Cadophora sp. DSE1049]